MAFFYRLSMQSDLLTLYSSQLTVALSALARASRKLTKFWWTARCVVSSMRKDLFCLYRLWETHSLHTTVPGIGGVVGVKYSQIIVQLVTCISKSILHNNYGVVVAFCCCCCCCFVCLFVLLLLIVLIGRTRLGR